MSEVCELCGGSAGLSKNLIYAAVWTKANVMGRSYDAIARAYTIHHKIEFKLVGEHWYRLCDKCSWKAYFKRCRASLVFLVLAVTPLLSLAILNGGRNAEPGGTMARLQVGLVFLGLICMFIFWCMISVGHTELFSRTECANRALQRSKQDELSRIYGMPVRADDDTWSNKSGQIQLFSGAAWTRSRRKT